MNRIIRQTALQLGVFTVCMLLASLNEATAQSTATLTGTLTDLRRGCAWC